METPGLSKNTLAFGLALALASVVNGLLVVVKESSPAVQAGMQKLTGHHWITHSAIILGLFLITGALLTRVRGGRGPALSFGQFLGTLVAGVVTGGLIILGFYWLGD